MKAEQNASVTLQLQNRFDDNTMKLIFRQPLVQHDWMNSQIYEAINPIDT